MDNYKEEDSEMTYFRPTEEVMKSIRELLPEFVSSDQKEIKFSIDEQDLWLAKERGDLFTLMEIPFDGQVFFVGIKNE